MTRVDPELLDMMVTPVTLFPPASLDRFGTPVSGTPIEGTRGGSPMAHVDSGIRGGPQLTYTAGPYANAAVPTVDVYLDDVYPVTTEWGVDLPGDIAPGLPRPLRITQVELNIDEVGPYSTQLTVGGRT